MEKISRRKLVALPIKYQPESRVFKPDFTPLNLSKRQNLNTCKGVQ